MRGWRLRLSVASFLLVLGGPAAFARETPRARVGIALGGGSARGFAHVGVLRWLEEHRVPVDAIAGTSAGAFIGGSYATGMSAAEIESMLLATDWEAMLEPDLPYSQKSRRRKEDDALLPIKLELGLRRGFRLQSGLNSGHQLGLLLSRLALPYSASGRFDDLPVPFRAVATDVQSGEVVVLDRGSLALAIRASMSLPGTFDPVPYEGRLLADGGILNNVPVDIAKSMGMDVVIAVNVSVPRRDRPEESIQGAANRAIRLMMRSLDRPRLEQADVVIVPDVTDFRASDLGRIRELAARGYEAAEAMSATLLRYSMSVPEWRSYLQEREKRRHPDGASIAFVEVTGGRPELTASWSRRLNEELIGAADPVAIASSLNAVIGQGRYASALYGRQIRGGIEGLRVDLRPKSYGPPLVKLSLDVDNEASGLDLRVGARTTLMDLAGAGSEWRVDTMLGSRQSLGFEAFQPFGHDRAMARGPFLAPRAFYSRIEEDLYLDGRLEAALTRRRVGGGLDAGWLSGRRAEIRAGYEVAHDWNSVRVGMSPLPADGGEREAHLRFSYEGQDRPHFPTRGLRLMASVARWRSAPGARGPFAQAEGRLSLAVRLGARQYATFRVEGAAEISGDTPLLHQPSLGGLFHLSAFPPQRFRGPNVANIGVGYRVELTRLPPLLGNRVYLMGLLEAGSAFARTREARFRPSATGGLGADTVLGPVFVGVSVGDRGALRASFLMGSGVR